MATTHATPEGTERYRKRSTGKLDPGHFRSALGLWFSSIGCGTYLGEPDEKTDRLYLEAILSAVASGVNVIDTAINYRCQRSERVIGQALKELPAKGIGREELILSTKGGFIPFDGGFPENPSVYFEETFAKPGVATFDDVVADCHCMTPAYLEHQLETSLKNLGLPCVDIFFIHNPETQLQEIPRAEFNRRMEAAFAFLEEKILLD